MKYELFKDVVLDNGQIGAVIKVNANGDYDLLLESPYWHQEYCVKEERIKGYKESVNNG